MYLNRINYDYNRLTGDNVIKNATFCGRVLGLRLGKDNNIYALDASQRLFKLDLIKGSKELVVDANLPFSFEGLFDIFLFDQEYNDTAYVTVGTQR